MPWTHTRPMLERAAFIAAHESGLYAVAELADRFGVSRKTAYKWLARYHQEGPDGLHDRSHAFRAHPHQTPPEVEALIVACREAHPTWGPKKLRPYLARRHPEMAFPATSTIGAVLQRHGLVEAKRKRRKPVHPGRTPLVTSAPGEVWAADFKGQFKTRDGVSCYPLTVCDAHSRFVLSCHALPSVAQVAAREQFERLFPEYDLLEYGLLGAIRSDNGTPFATRAICGLSQLSVWWIKLGIDHQRIEVGHPEQNGAHERMHRTLKAETARPPKRDMASQQGRFDAWRAEFNEERPHEALGGATPASVYRPSPRPMPEVLPKPEYAGHHEVRWISSAGTVKLKKHQFFVSKALVHEYVAFEEVGDGVWRLLFYDVELARLDERDFKLRA